MDKKKLLLVAVSVGIFLVIAIGAAILVFVPKNPASSSGVAAGYSGSGGQPGSPTTPYSYQHPVLPEVWPKADSTPNPADPAAAPASPAEPKAPAAPAPEGAGGTAPGGTTAVVPASGGAAPNGTTPVGGGTVISVPRPTSAAVPEAPPAGRAVSAPTRAAPKPAPRPAPARVAPKPAPAPAKVYDDYWVQTGAFSTIAKAETVKETLASKGITSLIENREVDGKNLFRVRVGPYTSQNEADYWLALIQSIGGFEESQVRLTQSKR